MIDVIDKALIEIKSRAWNRVSLMDTGLLRHLLCHFCHYHVVLAHTHNISHQTLREHIQGVAISRPDAITVVLKRRLSAGAPSRQHQQWMWLTPERRIYRTMPHPSNGFRNDRALTTARTRRRRTMNTYDLVEGFKGALTCWISCRYFG